MTDDELIEAMVVSAREYASPRSIAQAHLSVAAPEIERRLIERIRKRSLGRYGVTNPFTRKLDAFAKENSHGR